MQDASLDEIVKTVGIAKARRLMQYHRELLKWQKSTNLISDNTIEQSLNRHFLDSLQIIPLIHSTQDLTIVDVGSGAGFPGMVLAICSPFHVILVESDQRKMVFLKEIARITETINVTLLTERIENCTLQCIPYVVSRACASIQKLLAMCRHFISHETICLFHKGKNWYNEIVEATAYWDFEYEVIPSITHHEGVIIRLFHIDLRGKVGYGRK